MLLSQYKQYAEKYFYNSDYWGEDCANNPSNKEMRDVCKMKLSVSYGSQVDCPKTGGFYA